MANRIDILVNAKNQASAQLKQVQNDIGKIDSLIGRLASGPGVIGAILGIGGVGALAAGAVELARTAAQFETLERAFQSLAKRAGSSGDVMLGAMRNASSGMISDAKLIESANRAMMLGVADSADEMAQLLQVAMARGQAMGLSAEQAFNDLVTGIGRMSPLILDNLGIVTGGQKVFDDYAASIGKAADSLTDAEKKQALFAQVVRDSQADIATMTEAGDAGFQRLKASIDNAKVSIGQLYSADVIASAGQLSRTIDAAVEVLERLKTAGAGNVDPFAESWMGVAQAASIAGQAMTVAQSTAIASLADYDAKLMGSRQNVTQLADAETQASIATRQLGNDFISITGGLSQFNANLATTTGNVLTFTSVMSGFTGQINSIASGMVADLGAQGALGYAEDLTAEARSMVYQWTQAGIPLEQIQGILLPAFLSDTRKVNAELGTSVKTLNTVNSEYNTLQSTLAGIVAGATGPVAGVDAEDFLPREDEVNENARRLADIMVNGLKGQEWLGEFKAEVPGIWAEIESSGDPQGTAARILKDFQDGLRPELIDKDRAKDLARRALIGDKNTKALVDEIAGELAQEMGVSFAQAQAAASSAFGVSSSGDGGATSATIKPKIDVSSVDGAGIAAQLQAAVGEITIRPKVALDLPNSIEGLDSDEKALLASWVTAIYAAPSLTLRPKLALDLPSSIEGLTSEEKATMLMAIQASVGTPSINIKPRIGFDLGSEDEESGVGAIFAAAFTSEISSSTIGADVAGEIHTQIVASVSLIESSGTTAGQSWRKGFMNEVMQIPGDTLRTLALLVTPYVVANVTNQGGRTGAEGE